MARLAKILEISNELTVRNEWEQIYCDKSTLRQLRLNQQLSAFEDVNWNGVKQDGARMIEVYRLLLSMVEQEEKLQIFKNPQAELPFLSVHTFKSEYGEHMNCLIDDMCRCFEMEKQLILKVAQESPTPPVPSVEGNQISEDHLMAIEASMDILHGQLTELKSMAGNQGALSNLEAFGHAAKVFHNSNVENARVQREAHTQDASILAGLAGRLQTLLKQTQDVWGRLTLACDACNEELTEWKSLQKQHYISPGADDLQRKLNNISVRCAKTGLLLWKFLQTNQDILAFGPQKVVFEVINAISQEVQCYFVSLLQRSFLVTVQPEPFTLTSKKREFCLRILAAELLGLGSPRATAELVTETTLSKMRQSQCQAQIKSLVTIEAEISCPSPLREPKKFTMEMKRDDTKGPNKVWEDMHRIRFWVEIRLLESNPIHLETFSLPFVIVSAANQSVDGHGAVFWRLCDQNDIETSFDMPDALPWSTIGTALSDKFFHQTGRGLDEHQLQHLASRLNTSAEQRDIDGNIIEERMVTRDNFYKKILKDTEFTFWKWYYGSCNLLVTAPLLLGPWRDKLIYGFQEKTATEQLLQDQTNGTFLIRFSDSMVSDPKSNHITGLLSTSSIQDTAVSSHSSKFCHCDPYTVEILSKKSIGQLLIETDFMGQNYTKPFLYLYPEGRHCEVAFSKYIKTTPGEFKHVASMQIFF